MIYLLVFSFLSNNQSNQLVAKIAGKYVYKSDIPGYISQDSYLKRLLFFEIAKEKGYVDTVKAGIDRIYEEKLVKELYEEITSRAKVNQAEPYILYRKLKREVHLNLIKSEDFPTIYKAWSEIMRGKDFGEVSTKYSDDVRIKNKKGDVGWVKWDNNAPYFIKMPFSMKKGEISIPFKYSNEWYIVKVIDFRSNELQDYNNMEMGLKNQIVMKKKKEIADNHIEYIKWILDVEIMDDGLELLTNRLPKPMETTRYGRHPEFILEDMDKVLAISNLGEYTVRDFEEDIRTIKKLPPLKNKNAAGDFIEWRVIYDFLVLEAKRLGIQRKPAILNSYKVDLIRETVSKWKAYEIEPMISIDENNRRKYYKENQDKYRTPEKRKVFVIYVPTKERVNEIRGKLLAGKNFEEMASRYSIGDERGRGGLLGYIEEGKKGVVGEKAFKLKVGKISVPVKTDKGWAIIKVTDIKESFLPEYSALKYRITKDYKRYKREEIENKIFEQNKERFAVEIFESDEK